MTRECRIYLPDHASLEQCEQAIDAVLRFCVPASTDPDEDCDVEIRRDGVGMSIVGRWPQTPYEPEPF